MPEASEYTLQSGEDDQHTWAINVYRLKHCSTFFQTKRSALVDAKILILWDGRETTCIMSNNRLINTLTPSNARVKKDNNPATDCNCCNVAF